MKVIDLTHVIENTMQVFPGTEPPLLETACSYEKDGFKETRLSMYSHTGTHADAPAHFYQDRTTLDAFPPDQFIGKALVIDCTSLGEGELITAEHLAPYGEKANEADFLLFHTGWDRHWGTDSYFGDYPCIDGSVMGIILAGDYKGIGFDVMGLDPISDEDHPRHKKLLKEKDIINIENLCNLGSCGDELFWFGCFPLKLKEIDGAPVRAVAWFD